MSKYMVGGKMKRLFELYKLYLEQKDPSDTPSLESLESWLFDSLINGRIRIKNFTNYDQEAYIKSLLEKEEERICEEVKSAYAGSLKLKDKKERKRAKNAYQKTEEFKEAFLRAFEADPLVLRLKTPEFANDRYMAYRENQMVRFRQEAKNGACNIFSAAVRAEIEGLPVERILFELGDSFFKLFRKSLENYLKKNRLTFEIEGSLRDTVIQKRNASEKEEIWNTYTHPGHYDYARPHRLSESNLNFFVHSFKNDPFSAFLVVYEEGKGFWPLVLNTLCEVSEPLGEVLRKSFDPVSDFLDAWYDEICDFLNKNERFYAMSSVHVLSLLMENPFYKDIADSYYMARHELLDAMALSEVTDLTAYQKLAAKVKALGHEILEAIPDEYILMYPDARKLSRRFILHIGPTNSGKTYMAMQALREAGSGIYLAPLRLLAYEQYEALNRDGYICNLVTGEERLVMEEASFQASTVEMADLSAIYKCAVIDEAQMVSDRDRGGSWTDAILGLCAEEIHICAAPHAKSLLEKLIALCGDSCEVMYHERQTPLIVESRRFSFPKDVRPQDALIVFSRKNVHAVASELQTAKIKCSVLYGNLPYDVRQREAEKFMKGETKVVVATDAIGMGMNLPIRRIVFLETDKFDGRDRRGLFDEEFRQIAGRAGRRGLYEKGYVNAVRDKKIIGEALKTSSGDLTKAVIRFPDSLLSIDAKLSETIMRWKDLYTEALFEKADVEIMYSLCKELEHYSDDKKLIYSFLMIPFDEGNTEIHDIWLSLFRIVLSGEDIVIRQYIPSVAAGRSDSEYLTVLEKDYRLCDLLYAFCERFTDQEDIDLIMDAKKEISEKMITILSKQKLIRRKCKRCGRVLPWNTSFTVCEACYHGRDFF